MRNAAVRADEFSLGRPLEVVTGFRPGQQFKGRLEHLGAIRAAPIPAASVASVVDAQDALRRRGLVRAAGDPVRLCDFEAGRCLGSRHAEPLVGRGPLPCQVKGVTLLFDVVHRGDAVVVFEPDTGHGLARQFGDRGPADHQLHAVDEMLVEDVDFAGTDQTLKEGLRFTGLFRA